MATPPTFSVGAVLTAAQMNTIGWHLIKTQTIGTAVSSVSVTGVFSADYDNYRITLSGGAGSTSQSISLKLGASATGYYQSLSYITYATGAQTNTGVNNGASFTYIGESSANMQTINVDLFNPYDAAYTRMMGWYAGTVAGTIVGYHGVATSYTDFTIAVAGTMTGGTIRVYGYRD